jgi:hypothetical protein
VTDWIAQVTTEQPRLQCSRSLASAQKTGESKRLCAVGDHSSGEIKARKLRISLDAHGIKDKRRNDLLKERREVKRKAEEIKNNIFHTPQLAE